MQKVMNTVRGLDLFAVPVSLTYKGQKKFGTPCGGCFSIFIIICFMAYAGLTLSD